MSLPPIKLKINLGDYEHVIDIVWIDWVDDDTRARVCKNKVGFSLGKSEMSYAALTGHKNTN